MFVRDLLCNNLFFCIPNPNIAGEMPRHNGHTLSIYKRKDEIISVME